MKFFESHADMIGPTAGLYLAQKGMAMTMDVDVRQNIDFKSRLGESEVDALDFDLRDLMKN